jgi:hypothetical protein
MKSQQIPDFLANIPLYKSTSKKRSGMGCELDVKLDIVVNWIEPEKDIDEKRIRRKIEEKCEQLRLKLEEKIKEQFDDLIEDYIKQQ